MGNKKADFFDSRDKYLSFVNSTNEKSSIAFKLSSYLKKAKVNSDAFRIFDAGTGEGTIIATLLSAAHERFPEDPIFVVGKEISVDDIDNLLGFLADRFFEHKNLIFCITNSSYNDFNKQNLTNVKFIKKELKGKTSFSFTKQLLGMNGLIKKNWELKEENKSTLLLPKQKTLLAIYREDQKVALDHLIPNKINDIPIKYDFIIASQAFRLRSPYKRTMNLIISPLLRILESKGQFFLIYSSGNDFTKKMLKYFFPTIKPFQYNDPKEFIKEVNKDRSNKKLFKISVSSFIYTFINMSLTSKKRFSPMNSMGLWNAVTYVGQISEKEQNAININTKLLDKVSELGQKLPLKFKDYLLRFEKNGD
tara:strand:+ start:454 stop:1545 length:1092 start_codon:yes stop_codon:yes gene_type:complete